MGYVEGIWGSCVVVMSYHCYKYEYLYLYVMIDNRPSANTGTSMKDVGISLPREDEAPAMLWLRVLE